ncbi:BAI1-associated protein 3-like, partial [Tropilaelaps mercedesae]
CLAHVRRMSALHFNDIFKNSRGDDASTQQNLDKDAIFKKKVEKALGDGTQAWLRTAIASHRPMIQSDNDSLVQGFVDVLTDIAQDIRFGDKYYNDKFIGGLGVPYTRVIYRHFELGLEDQLSTEIMEVVNRMDADEAWATHGPDPKRAQDRSMRAGTKLYELYIALQEVINLRKSIDTYEPAQPKMKIHKFHEWFTDAVQNWFLMAKTKSKGIITNAFNVDVQDNKLKALDKVKHSSSAVDTSGCVRQINNFWRELNWPDKAASYPLIIRILEAICECTLHYAALCHQKLNEEGYFDVKGQFDVAQEVSDVLDAIAATEGERAAVMCRAAIEAMIHSTDEDVVNKTLNIIKGLSEKIRPEIRKGVYRAAWESEKKGVEEALISLYEYLEENLANTYSQLEHVNFYRFTAAIWRVMLEELDAIAWENRGTRPAFFARLDDAAVKMAAHFHSNGNGLSMNDVNSDEFKRLKARLKRMSSPTSTLIEEYLIERLERQNDRIEAIREGAHPYGFLAVKAAILYLDQIVYVHVLRARNLVAMDRSGSSDPYVKVELMPRNLFAGVGFKKTQIVKNTLNPIWGEELSFKVPNLRVDEATGCADFGKSVCLRLTIMDYDFVGANDFEGECFLSLKDLPVINKTEADAAAEGDLKIIDILDMPLSQPLEDDEYLGILEHRHWDPEAQRFASEQRKREM